MLSLHRTASMSAIIIPDYIAARRQIESRTGAADAETEANSPARGKSITPVTLVRAEDRKLRRVAAWTLLVAILVGGTTLWLTLGMRHIPPGSVGLMPFSDGSEVYPSGTYYVAPWSPRPHLLNVGVQVTTVELGGMVADREGLPIPSLRIEVVHRFNPAFAQRMLSAGPAGSERVRVRIQSAVAASMVEVLSELTSSELSRIGFRLSPLLDERVRALVATAWPDDLRDGIIIEEVRLAALAVDEKVQRALVETQRQKALTALLEGVQ